LIDPTTGSVSYEGEDVCQMSKSALQEFRRHKTAMVFQKFALLPHRTVIENTVYGLEIQGVNKEEAKTRALKWIDRVGLSGFEDHFPNRLSGGMQQRVGLARALTNDADILLMDEAFSALDPLIRTDMQSVLLDIQEELRKTIVFITHDLDEALRLGDHIAILRDGEVIQQGSGQEIVLNPADAYIADFIKEVNRGRVISVETIMNTTPIEGGTEIALKTSDMLETAAQAMAQKQQSSANVFDGRNNLVGSIQLKDTIDAMVTAATH